MSEDAWVEIMDTQNEDDKDAADTPWWKRREADRPMFHPLGQLIRSNKVGRNDPCPCGSGKKHKRCHNPGKRSYAVKPHAPHRQTMPGRTLTDLDEM